MFSLTGEQCSSRRLPLSFLDSLIGERGVLSLELPLLENIRSPSTGLFGDVGEVGERGDRDPRSQQEFGERAGGSPGESGDAGEGGKRLSSLGLLSILMIGGTPSTDLDLLPPNGDGDRDLLALLEQKLPL